MREMGSFKPGEMVGGTAAHWGGNARRFLPHDFEIRSKVEERYGKKFFPEDCTAQDWGVTWDDIEPYYDQFEHIYGVHGKAGNLNGEIREAAIRTKARARASIRIPRRSARLRRRSSRRLRRARLRAVPGTGRRHDPRLQQSLQGGPPRVPARRLLLEPRLRAGRKGESPLRGDARPLQAEEFRAAPALQRHQGQHRFHRQEGDRRHLYRRARPRGRAARRHRGAWRPTPSTTRGLLLLSGIGKPYDPQTGKGVVGRNYSYQVGGRVHLFYDDREFNPFIGGGMVNTSIDELNGDVIDRGRSVSSAARTSTCRIPAPRRSRQAAAARHAALGRGVEEGDCAQLPAHVRHTHSRLVHELPPALPRPRPDLQGRQRTAAAAHDVRLAPERAEDAEVDVREGVDIAKAMKPSHYHAHPIPTKYSIIPYQSTHNIGGAIMGTDPSTSVVNKYCQSWDVPNLFVVGGSAFPQNPAQGPTETIGMLACWAADGIKENYIPKPGPIV
jgi:gluconate 2-dehydrogenase alpha chain